MATETELKLAVAPADWRRLERRLARWGAPQRQTLLARYLDTDEAFLARQRMGLRLRREGGQWIQTLKTEGRAGALTARGEWNSPARLMAGRPVVDALALAETPLAPLLSDSFVAGLKTCFEVRMRRASWRVDFAGAHIEIALDRGEARAGGARAPVSELELELLSGSRSALIELALQLVQGQGRERPLALLCAVESKAGRGLRLLRNARVEPIQPGTGADLWCASAPAAEVLRRLLPAWVTSLAANSRGLAEAEDAETLHQCEVALRRMLVALKALGESGDFPAALRHELLGLASALSRVRAAEVLPLHGIEPGPGRSLAVPHGAGTALASPRFARLMLELLAWAESPAPEPSGEAAGRRLARVLEPQAKRLRLSLLQLEALDSCAWHRVRLRAERLRWAIELSTPASPWHEALDALEQAAIRLIAIQAGWAARGDPLREAGRGESGARIQAARDQALEAGRRVLTMDWADVMGVTSPRF